jgi:hypothetical protein
VRQVVLKDNSGAQDPSAEHQLGPRCLQYLVPDLIEEDGDPWGSALSKRPRPRPHSVVERGIET